VQIMEGRGRERSRAPPGKQEILDSDREV